MKEHEEGHGHHHHHHHHHHEISGIKLTLTIILNFVITLAEIVGGIIAGSLSLISDALHNLSDGLALVISFLAIKIAGRANDQRRTYGYKRASILAALLNSSVLVGISVFLFREAYIKLLSPRPVDGGIVVGVAIIGLLANLLGVLLLRRSATEDLNIKSAYFHLLSDTLSSVAVIVGGLGMIFFKIYWIDPVLTVLISLYVLKESYEILKQTVNILMQGVPSHLNLDKIVQTLEQVHGVQRVHHVHLWNLDEKNVHFEAHLDVEDMPVSQAGDIGDRVAEILREKYEITHITLQYECAGCGPREVINERCCK